MQSIFGLHFNTEPIQISNTISKYYRFEEISDRIKRALEFGGCSRPALGYHEIGRKQVHESGRQKKKEKSVHAQEAAFISMLIYGLFFRKLGS